jgi:hypothetical protein
VKVQLTKKLVQIFNDVDLTCVREGDTLELPARDARILLAAEWALRVEQSKADKDSNRKSESIQPRRSRAEAADRRRSRRSA